MRVAGGRRTQRAMEPQSAAGPPRAGEGDRRAFQTVRRHDPVLVRAARVVCVVQVPTRRQTHNHTRPNAVATASVAAPSLPALVDRRDSRAYDSNLRCGAASRLITAALPLGAWRVAVCTTERTWGGVEGGFVWGQLGYVGAAQCATLPSSHCRLHTACAAALMPPACHRRAHGGGTAPQQRVRRVASSQRSHRLWNAVPLEWLGSHGQLTRIAGPAAAPSHSLGGWGGAAGGGCAAGRACPAKRQNTRVSASQTQGKWKSWTTALFTQLHSLPRSREWLSWLLRLAPDRGVWAAVAPSGPYHFSHASDNDSLSLYRLCSRNVCARYAERGAHELFRAFHFMVVVGVVPATDADGARG